jgi:hypothetical protein
MLNSAHQRLQASVANEDSVEASKTYGTIQNPHVKVLLESAVTKMGLCTDLSSDDPENNRYQGLAQQARLASLYRRWLQKCLHRLRRL